MGVEYSLSSLERYIGCVTIGSSASFNRNMGVMSAMAFLLKYSSTVVDENNFEMKQLIWLKIEAMNEDWVKFWRVSVCKFSRVFAVR